MTPTNKPRFEFPLWLWVVIVMALSASCYSEYQCDQRGGVQLRTSFGHKCVTIDGIEVLP